MSKIGFAVGQKDGRLGQKGALYGTYRFNLTFKVNEKLFLTMVGLLNGGWRVDIGGLWHSGGDMSGGCGGGGGGRGSPHGWKQELCRMVIVNNILNHSHLVFVII